MLDSQKTQSAEKQKAAQGRRERRAAETRLKIFRAAVQLFAKNGHDRVTVEEITEAADVGKGTFFNYFASKDHVLGVLVEIQMAKVKEALAKAAQEGSSTRAVLLELAQRVAEEPARSPEMARTVISSFLTADEVRTRIYEMMLEGRRTGERIAAIGQARGEIDRSLDPCKVAAFFQRMVMGTILFWSLRGSEPLADSLADSFELFWRAVAAREQEV